VQPKEVKTKIISLDQGNKNSHKLLEKKFLFENFPSSKNKTRLFEDMQ
jgi:hypothetical protein